MALSKRIFLNLKISILLIGICSLGNISCSPKIYPSGIEGNLFGYERNFNREQRVRKRASRRMNRQMARAKREENRPIRQREKELERLQKELYKEHFLRQDPHVQKRMKQNLRETKKKYPSKNTLSKKLVFWKKNKCAHGS